MALMLHLRMAAGSLSGTVESTLGRLCTAWLRWLQYSPTTSAANILKDGFEAAGTRSFVTKRSTRMVAAFQWSTTNFQADVFRFELISIGRCIQRSMLPLRSLSFTSLLLAGTASLTTFVTTAIEGGATYSRALRWLIKPLMTNRV